MIKQTLVRLQYRNAYNFQPGRNRIDGVIRPWRQLKARNFVTQQLVCSYRSLPRLSRLSLIGDQRYRGHSFFSSEPSAESSRNSVVKAATLRASPASLKAEKNPDDPAQKKAKERQKEQAKKTLSKAGELSRWKYINPLFLTKKVWTWLRAIGWFLVNPREVLPKLANGWKHFKLECLHYWNGFKLLWVDIKFMFPLLKKLLKGKNLTYRERNQLKRTSLDCLRIIPFSMFILIPALEVLLPVALYLFPNMLPSTFEKKSAIEKKRKQVLAVRLELASFVEEMLSDYVKIMQKKDKDHKEYLPHAKLIVTSMREQKPVSTSTILKVAKLFDDHITIDNMNREKLETLCRFMLIGGISFASDEMLRRSLKSKMNTILRDDRLIKEEGVNVLNIYEVNHALRERGMRGDNNLDYARARLAKWISLSQDQSIPISLLIMSRAFNFRLAQESSEEARDRRSSREKPEEALLAEVLSKEISDDAVDKMLVEKAGVMDSEMRAKVLKREKQLIEDDAEHEKTIESKAAPLHAQEKEKAAKSKLENLMSKLTPEEIAAKKLQDPSFVEEYVKPALEEKDNKDKVTKIKLEQESLKREIEERKQKEVDEQKLLKCSKEEVTPASKEVEDDIAEEIGVDDELREMQAEVIEYWKDNLKVTKLSNRVGKMIKKLEKLQEGNDKLELNDDELMERVQELYEKEKATKHEIADDTSNKQTKS